MDAVLRERSGLFGCIRGDESIGNKQKKLLLGALLTEVGSKKYEESDISDS
jgi:hypothetical protein